ncbi:MAG TPA: protein kinase [Polyangiaceae bacterium]|nr:protein kinase [Polyangiaceae bacterium]
MPRHSLDAQRPPRDAAGEAERDAIALSEHDMLAKQFRAVRFLGAGPDGTALAATRRDGGDEVELRFVQEHAQTDALLERWSRYQLVDHPHVISLQQVEYAGSAWCAVLETPPLESLELTAGGRFEAEVATRLLEQIASALAAAHDVGLWHGSLSADSVLFDPRRGARLEFTGVAVSRPARALEAPPARWQEADAYTDLFDLARLAERLFGGLAAAQQNLPWLARLKDDDACRRPAAKEVFELLRRATHPTRVSVRSELSTVDTERPRRASPSLSPVAALAALSAAPAPASAVQLAPSLGARVGRFRLEELLGEGGMGSVYRAVDVASGQTVALKLLKPELLADEAVRYRFKKEARVLQAVRSPYIANLVEAEVSDSNAYIALEFVSGRDLAVALDSRDSPLDEPLALQLVADMCRALVEPHRRGIVHRDIKPQNVLVLGDLDQRDGVAIKLCDFGIASAKLSAETVGMTQDGRLWGTPQYMAPEQCASAPVSPATDVYALGLTLYELIAGRPAFEGDDLLQILRQQLNEAPPELRSRATVSDGTAAIVARALEKHAPERFADATELLAALELVRNGQARPLARASAAPRSSTAPERIEFSVDLASAAPELWPYVSDTERMNQVVGLPPVQIERQREAGSSRVFLSNRVLGMQLRWQEHPFEWIEGHRWSVLRVFDSGLIRWYRVQMDLEPLAAGGTRLRYAMEFEPRWSALAWLVRLEVGVKQKAKLLRIFRRVDALLREGSIQRTPSPHAAPGPADARLARRVSERLEPLVAARVDAAILQAIAQHVVSGAEAEIARLRPLRFARARGLDERAFTEACLLASHAGLFDLLWDVLCPLCQIPATFADSLERLETHASCPACELQFPLRFADSVELVFRVSPEVRANELQAYCIGGPAHSPHVAAQLRLGPGEGRVLALALSDGRHRIRSPELPGVLELDVAPEHAFVRADLVIGSRLRAVRGEASNGEDARLAPLVSESVQLGSGQQTLGLRNELDREITLRIERTAARSDALTAARAWSIPKFRELFPAETLESGRLVAVGQVSFLILRVLDHLSLIEKKGDAVALTETVRAFDRLQVVAERHQGRLAASNLDMALAAFERPEDACRAALALLEELSDDTLVACSLALHRGPAVATRIDDRMAYYGRTLVRALELSLASQPRHLLVSAAALGGEATHITRSPGIRAAVQPAPLLGPAEWCVLVEPALKAPRDGAARTEPTPARSRRPGG